MHLKTQTTLALLQELLMALRANDYRSWLALGIQELGRDVAGEVESEWMVPLLVLRQNRSFSSELNNPSSP